jgi:TolB-like protein/AraC-like DNA-binding protein
MPPDDHALTNALDISRSPRPPAEAAIPRDIRKALVHMRASGGERMTEAELAAICGVPERTLRKHFKRFIGVSPIAHLRRLRLAAARGELLACEGSGSVTEIATRHGFAHLGRFAADYARHFGEPPSATLARGRREAAEREQDRRREDASRVLAVADEAGVRRPQLSRQVPTLTIVPFDGAAGREEVQFAADLAAQLAAALCRLHGLSVMLAPPAPASARDWRHDARRAAAQYCLAGRITRAAERVRVVVQLLDVATGAHLWGDCYDGHVREPLEFFDRIAADVPDHVAGTIRQHATARAERRRPGSSTADDLVLRAGPMLYAGDPASVTRAIGLLDDAMAMDPDHAQAPALAAWGHGLVWENRVFSGESDLSDPAAKLRVQNLARRAIALDTTGDPIVLQARAMLVRGQGDREQSEAIIARAVAIDPAASLAWGQSGFWKNGRRDTDGAIRDLNRAIRLEGARTPLASRLVGIGCAHFIAGRYWDSALWLRRALAANPDAISINRNLAATYVMLGEKQAARAALDALRRAYPGVTVTSCAAISPPGCREKMLNALASIGLPA